MVDRRMVVAGMVGAAVAPLLGKASAASAKAIRYNATSPQGQKMLATYVKGVKAMKAMSPAVPQAWTFQWYTHWSPKGKAAALKQVFPTGGGTYYALAQAMWDTCQAHGNSANEPYFCFWHRLFVLYLERMIASVTNTPTFTLPYWDYTTPGAAALPSQFRLPGDPIWGPLYQANRNVAGNGNANVNGGDQIDRYAPGSLTLAALNASTYTAFNQTLDFGLHGSVHVLVGNGTNMGSVPTAAEDPIFWLHHANIDRIWYAWSAAGGVNPTTFAQQYTFANPNGTAASVALNSVANIQALPYRYDSLPVAPGRVRPKVLTESVVRKRLLLTSAPEGTLEGPALSETPPIRLDGNRRVIPLRAAAPGASLLETVQAQPATRLSLVVRGVSATAPPQTLFGVYLNLPANVPVERAAAYRIGILNFFAATAMPGMETMPGMAARDIEFDLTDAVRGLLSTRALAADSAITIVPLGTPAPGSNPTISGALEVSGE